MMKFIQYLASPFSDVKLKTSTYGKNIPVLDGIRGLAVLIVLASHTNAFCMYAQGSLGVLLFFFLSGFVLIIPFYEKPNTIFQKNTFLKYCLNRAFRIIPAYIVIVGATAIIQHKGYEWYLWNISFIKGWNHFWSVAEEVRFYLLFPVVISCMALVKNKYTQLILISIVTYMSYKFRNEHVIDMMDGRHVGFYFYMFMGGVLTYLSVNLPISKRYLRGTIVQKVLTTLSFLILCSFMFSSSELIKKFWRPLFHNLPENLVLNGWYIPHVWLIIFVILFLLYHFSYATSKKRIAFVVSLISLFFACFSVAMAFQKESLDHKDNPAIVFAKESRVKSEANKTSEEVFRLHEGTKVQVLETYDDWYKIELSDKSTGWIPSKDIKILKTF